MIQLADQFGLFWETIWNHPANEAVKAARGTPHVLLPGDRVHIPEIRVETVDCATEQKHAFRRKGIPLSLEVDVREDGEGMGGKRYVLLIEGRTSDGTVPASGVITVHMMPQDRTGELRVHVGDKVRVYQLEFGALDPPQTESGALARLRNLGYASGATLAESGLALKKFQRENGLAQTGTLTPETAGKLAEKHGS
ncbi:MAG: peptidoglycan-binding domain-containing protein [Phycisphaerales bacterium]